MPSGEVYVPPDYIDEEEKELAERIDGFRYQPRTKLFELMLDYLGIQKEGGQGSEDEEDEFNAFKVIVMKEAINSLLP